MSKVKAVTFQEEGGSPPLLATRLWEFITNCGEKGAMLAEMYEEFPNDCARNVRTKVKDFTNQKLLDTTNTCRCSRGTIYIAKKFKNAPPLVKISGQSMANKNKEMKLHRRKGKKV